MTIVDFESKIKTRYEMSSNGLYFREINNEKITYYEKDVVKYNQQLYKKMDEMIETDWKKVIAEMKPNHAVEVYGIFHTNIDIREIEYFPFNNEITNSI